MFAAPPIQEVELIRDIASAFNDNPDNPIKIEVQFGESANFVDFQQQLEAGEVVHMIQGPVIDHNEAVSMASRGGYTSGRYFAWVCGGDDLELARANARWHKMIFKTEEPFVGIGRPAHWPIDFPSSDPGSIRFLLYEPVGGIRANAQPSEGGDYYAIQQLIEFTALKIE